ncbi:MAG: 1-acyl-sn-glycerol-3-phosphate acyltransferase [Pseudomonadales bacterium]
MFDDIRPYNDAEVNPVLQRLLHDRELLTAIRELKFPRWPAWLDIVVHPLLRAYLAAQTKNIESVYDFQILVKKYLQRVIADTTSGFTHSGIENLPRQKACLFMSNHRDIAMDSAFVNYALHSKGLDTVRIAIGDNLLTKPFASDLMRLNKSFIVQRSAKGPRQVLAAYKTLSAYIRQSIEQDQQPIWIAQREGRAKDGNDATEPAIIKMLSMSLVKGERSLTEHIAALNIVPVAISYEYDPCDLMKARELHAVAHAGEYAKAEHEDISSIAAGIAGNKGHVHVAFGTPLQGEFQDAAAVAAALDQQILTNYTLHPSNCIAWQQLRDSVPDVLCSASQQPFEAQNFAADAEQFKQRVSGYPRETQELVLQMYARPVTNKLNVTSHVGVA